MPGDAVESARPAFFFVQHVFGKTIYGSEGRIRVSSERKLEAGGW